MNEKDLKELEKEINAMNKEQLKELALQMLISRKKSAIRRMKHYNKNKNKGAN